MNSSSGADAIRLTGRNHHEAREVAELVRPAHPLLYANSTTNACNAFNTPLQNPHLTTSSNTS